MEENDKKDEVEKNENVETTETKNEEVSSSEVKAENAEKNESKEEPKEQPKNTVKTDEPKKKKSVAKIAFLIILLAIIIGGVSAAVYFIFFAPKSIDLAKYINVEYTGFNEYATAEVSIDTDELGDFLYDKSLAKKFAKKVELEVKNNEKLTNGKNLEVKATISSSWLKNRNLKLKDKNVSIEIEGLEVADVVDLFEGIEIEFSGISPNLSVTINNNNSDKFIRTVDYYADKSYGLANGDTITIEANYDEDEANELGLVVAEDTMEYTIKDQPYYINSKNDLSETVQNSIKEDLLEEVKEQAEYDNDYLVSVNYENISYTEDFTHNEPELVNLYLLTPKKEGSYFNSNNIIYGIYKVIFTSTTTGANYEWYYVAKITDTAISADNEYDDEDTYITVSSRWDETKTLTEAYDNKVATNKSDYIIETII